MEKMLKKFNREYFLFGKKLTIVSLNRIEINKMIRVISSISPNMNRIGR